MTEENGNTDEYYQNILRENGLPPETTKGQYLWYATKRALKRAAWMTLIFAGFTAFLLWHFAPDALYQLFGGFLVALAVAWPFVATIGLFYIGYLVVKALQKAGRD
ncbi:MAG: hypothetical protein AB7I36_17920 [Rhodospirillaceae bacterium]